MPATELAPGLLLRADTPPPPLELSAYRLAAFDMDSTLINIECVDEIAAAVGRKAEVAAITEAAMRGEITDFKASLRQRVALLKGVTRADLQRVLDERLQLNPGVAKFVGALQAAGVRTLLVSGGFTFFSAVVRGRLQMDFARANVLEMAGDQLTGRMIDQPWGDIVDGEQKRRTVLDLCDLMGITPSQAIAVGDGANDLPMMEAVGLSIAFHAKPAVRERAVLSLVDGGMDRLLQVLK